MTKPMALSIASINMGKTRMTFIPTTSGQGARPVFQKKKGQKVIQCLCRSSVHVQQPVSQPTKSETSQVWHLGLWEQIIRRLPLSEFGVDASYFAGIRAGCCLGGAWHVRARSREVGWRQGTEIASSLRRPFGLLTTACSININSR